MTQLIKDLMQQAGTDTSGKWMGVDHASKFAELVVKECCEVLSTEAIRHDGYGFNQHALYRKMREHFGIEQ